MLTCHVRVPQSWCNAKQTPKCMTEGRIVYCLWSHTQLSYRILLATWDTFLNEMAAAKNLIWLGDGRNSSPDCSIVGKTIESLSLKN